VKSETRHDITWEIEAICAAEAVVGVAHVVAWSQPRPRCWIVDTQRLKDSRVSRLALPPPRD